MGLRMEFDVEAKTWPEIEKAALAIIDSFMGSTDELFHIDYDCRPVIFNSLGEVAMWKARVVVYE